MSKIIKSSGWNVFTCLCWPVHKASATIGKVIPHNKTVAHITIGSALILTGSTLATLHWPFGIPHVVSDGVSYLIHGFGCAPIINAVLKD